MNNGVKYGIEIRVEGNKAAVDSFDEVTQAQARTGEAARDAGAKIGKHFSEINVGATGAVKAQTSVGESWAKSGTAAQEAAKKIVKSNEEAITAQKTYEKEQQKQEKERQSTQARVERDQQRFIEGLNRKVDAIGKTNSQLAAMRAQELGVSDAASPMIAKLAQTEQGVAKVGMSAAATAAAMRNVPAQFTDIVVSLQAGQSPMTVMMQQGGQLKDMFGGVGGAAKALGGYVLGLINPLTLTAAAVGVLGFAWYQGSQELKEYQRAIILTGNISGVTSDRLADIAANINKAGQSSKGVAAEAVTALVMTGNVASENLERFASVSVTMQKTVGLAISDTAKDLSELAKSPLEASKKLSEQYHYLTKETYDQIKALLEHGKTSEAAAVAQTAYINSFDKRSKEIRENLGYLERSWNSVRDGAKGAWDAMLNIGREETKSDQLQRLQTIISNKQFYQNEKIASGNTNNSIFKKTELELAALREEEKALKALIDAKNGVATATGKARQEEEKSIKQAEKLEAYLNAGAHQTKAQALKEEAKKFEEATAGLSKTSQEYRNAEAANALAIKDITEKFRDKNTEVKKQENAYKSFLVTLKEKLALSEAELDNERNLTEGQKLRTKFDADLRAGTIKATAAQIEHARAIATQIDFNNRLEASRKEDLKVADEQADATVKLTNSVDDYITSLASANQQTSLELKLATESEGKRKIAIEQQKVDLELKKQIKAIEASKAFAEEKPALIKKATEAAERRKEQIVIDVDLDEMRKARKELDAFLDPAKAQSFGDALVGSLNNAGNALQKLSVSLQEYGRTEAELAKARDNAEKVRALDPVKYAQSIAVINERSTRAQIQSYASIAGAAKGFFAEGTKGYKALEAVEKIYHASQLAMNLSSVTAKLLGISSVTAATVAGEATKSAAVTASVGTEVAANVAKGTSAAAVGVATQASGDPYTAIPRMAAMAAIMAGLGFATGFFGTSGGGGMTAEQRQKEQGTGSVFGDLTAKSDSIAKSIDDMSKGSSRLLPVNQGMLAALKNIESSMAGFTNLVVRDQGVINGSNLGIKTGMVSGGNGVTNLVASIGEKVFGSSILGTISRTISNLFSNTKQTIVDSGVQFGGKLSDLQTGKGFSQYASVDTTKSSWFGLSKSTSNSIQSAGLSDELSSQLGLIFTNMSRALREANKSLGGSATEIEKTLNDLTLTGEKVSLKGLSGTALTEALNSVISKSLDEMAAAAFPQYDKFREVGEGYAQTVLRVANTFASVNESLGEVNLKLFDVGQAGVEASLGLAKTLGGLENLQAATNAYYQDFFTEEERAAKTRAALAKELSTVGIALPADRQSYRAALENASNAGQQETVATMLRLASAFASVTEEAKSAVEQDVKLVEQREAIDQRMAASARQAAQAIESQVKATEELARVTAQKAYDDKLVSRLRSGDVKSIMSDNYSLNPIDFKKYTGNGQFDAAGFNSELLRQRAELAVKLATQASIDAINVEDITTVLSGLFEFTKGREFENELRRSLPANARNQVSATVGYVFSDFIDATLAGIRLNNFTSRGQGITSVIAAQEDLQFQTDLQTGYRRSLSSANEMLRLGIVNQEQYSRALADANDLLARNVQTQDSLREALKQAGIDSTAFYFDQIGKSVSALNAAAVESQEPLAKVNASIGRLTSISDVFSMSSKAAGGDANAELVAKAAAMASAALTTQSELEVAKKLGNKNTGIGKNPNELRDLSSLIEGVREFDARTLEVGFLRISDALNKGDINKAQYEDLFNVAMDQYKPNVAAKELVSSFSKLKSAAESLSRSLKLDDRLSTLSPTQKISEASRQYYETLNSALAGNSNAVSQYESVAKNYADILYENAATYEEYKSGFDSLITNDALIMGMDDSNKTQEAMLAELGKLREEMEKILAAQESTAVSSDRTAAALSQILEDGIPDHL